MKNLIVTRADDNIKEMCKITHPTIAKYATVCKAEFKVLSDNKNLHPHYRILQLYDLFKEYDRILCIDSDVLILKSCPNIFNIVENHKIGSIYEDKGSRKFDRRNRIQKIQEERGNIGWTKGYINTGVILFSRMHRDLFNITENELYLDLGYDDLLLRYRAIQKGYEIHELPCEFNFMSMFTESWCNKRKSDAYIIHYAGIGNFYNSLINKKKEDFIKEDCLILKKYNLLF